VSKTVSGDFSEQISGHYDAQVGCNKQTHIWVYWSQETNRNFANGLNLVISAIQVNREIKNLPILNFVNWLVSFNVASEHYW